MSTELAGLLTRVGVSGMELKPPLQGNQVTVVVEEMDGGNYSCHSSDGQYLNHTIIFVQLDTEKIILEETSPNEGRFRTNECVFERWCGSKGSSVPPGPIQCSAPKYTGPFHCSWSKAAPRSDAAVLLFNATR